MRGELFLRAARLALDEVGDPTRVKSVLDAPAQLRPTARPPSTVKRIAWNVQRLAMFADDPARAYAQLHELCNTLFEPLATQRRPAAPAPEVAMTLSPGALLDALAPQPRVMPRELAVAAKLDSEFLLADPRSERRVLGVRSISPQKLSRLAPLLAELIAMDPDPIVRAEILEICVRASEAVRARIAAALALHTEHASSDVRAAALDGLRTLKLPLADSRLVARLADPDAVVRAAAARSVLPTSVVGDALVARLADDDATVRAAALDAVARCVSLHRPTLVAPLRALVQRHDGDTRTAIYLLGKLHNFATDDVVATLRDCLAGPRSDVARAAAIVLGQLGAPTPEVPVETRLLRAARELAAADRETQLAGLFEASRLGEAARPLIPALRRLGEVLSAVDDSASRATFAQVCEALIGLGVPTAELPRPRTLDPWRSVAPRERAVHGAYAIVDVPATKATPATSALGLWDHATGAVLFVIEGAELLELLPGRAEVGVIRVVDDDWHFERYRVPTGERVGSLEIPETLTHGWPSSLAAAGGLVTVWCGDEDDPYRFHIKLGDPDRLLDVEPNVGRRNAKRGSKPLPRR
jgi:HEAT repeat protein